MMNHKSKSVYEFKNQVVRNTRRLSTVIMNNDIIKKIFEATNLLLQLDDKFSTLTNYFALYMNTSDQLDGIKNDLKNSLKEHSLQKIYTLLYTGTKVLPKVYLMAILGSLITFESNNEIKNKGEGQDNIQEIEDINMKIFKRILQDIMSLINVVVYPSNLFCARYFILTSIKNQLNLINTTLAVDFLLENLKGMNSSINQSINEDIKEKPELKEEDKTLAIFINENFNTLLSLPGMDKTIFKDKVLSEILPIIYIQTDKVYNEYIIDWIISGLSEEFVVSGLEAILAIMLPLYGEIDNSIPKKLKHIIDRLLNYLKVNSLSKNELAELQNNFDQLFVYINNIAEMAKNNNVELKQFMEFLDTMMSFVLCCSNTNTRASHIFSLLKILNSYLEDFSKLNQEHIEIYNKYCKDLFDSKLCFFDIQILFTISKHFKEEDKRKACYNILLLLIRYENNKIDCSEKVSTVLDMITIILENSNVCKSELATINAIINRIFNPNPEKLFECYLMLKNIYLLIDKLSINESLPVYFLCFNNLINNCEMTYLIQNNLIEAPQDLNFFKMDLSNYTTEEDLVDFFVIVYNIPKDEMRDTFSAFSQINLNYLLDTLKQINLHKIGKDKMIDQFLESITTFLKILLGELLTSSIKVDLTYKLIKIVVDTSLLPKEKYLFVTQTIIKICKCFQKRTDTTKILIYSCELYYNNNLKDINKIKERLEDAFNEAEYVLVKIENLIIFPMILDKIFYYADKVNATTNFVSLQIVDKIIQAITENLPAAKEENPKLGEEVEILFEKCKAHIKEMKEKGVEYYQAISILK